MAKQEITSYNVERKFGPFFSGENIEFSKDCQHIFCCCADSVNVVEVASSRVVHVIPFEDDEVVCLSVSPDAKTLVVATKSNLIHHYDIPEDIASEAPSLVRKFKSYHLSFVTVLCWDSSSSLLATGSSDGTARVWSITQKFCTHNIKMNAGVVKNVLFSPKMKDLSWVICSAENIIFIWELLQGSSKLVAKMEDGHHSSVTGIVYVEKTNKLISCGLDKVIVLWDLENFKVERIVPTFESLLAIVLQPPGKFLFENISKDASSSSCVMAVGEKGLPTLWDMDNAKCLWQADEPVVTKTEQGGIAIIKEMKLVEQLDSILFTTYEHTIMFFQIGTMKLEKQLTGFNGDILDICFVGENDSHLAVATNSSQLRVYDSVTLSCQLLRGHSATIITIARHPHLPDIFSSGSHDNSALIWKLTSGSAVCIAKIVGHTHSINSLAFGKDFIVSGSNDMCLKRWHLDNATLNPADLSAHGTTSLHSSHTEKAHENRINCLCVSTNSKFVGTASQDKLAKVWDAHSLSLLGTLKGHRKGIWFIEFSPVDQLIATSSADGCIKIWVLSDFSNVSTLESHEVSVLRFCWLNDGSQLVSSGADGILKLWSLKKGMCIKSFDEHDAKVWALASSNDGARIVSGGEDSTIVWWKDVTEEELVKSQEEQQRLVMQDQLLQNLLKDKKWSKALILSIKLAQPHRSLNIMKKILDEQPADLHCVLSRLSLPKLMSLMEFAIQWNTKTTNVREAQSILKFVLEKYTLEELEALPNWKDVIECFLPYTERHFRRVSALSQSSNIIDYIVSSNSFAVCS